MRNFFVDPPRPIVRTDIIVYHAQPHLNRDQLRRFVRPELFVDIESVLEEKLAMLGEHESQRVWLDESQGMKSYLDSFKEASRELGAASKRYQFAEGWRRHHHAGFGPPEADPLSNVLGERGLCFADEEYARGLRP